MTKVSPASDLSTFLATLERSALLPPDELARLTESLGQAADPKAAARELIKQGKLTRWQASQLLHGYHQLVFGKYKLLDQLGSGEMGRVYLAEHGQLGRRVALKALSRKHTADPRIVKLFLADARRVGGLDHPNLCHMYDVNQEADRYFLVMEYVEGQNLQQYVEKGGVPGLERVIDIVRQTAAGLDHAHTQKVLHGDLKPTNIIIDKNGRVKILDIGLSRLTEATGTPGIDDTGEAPSLASGIYRPQEQIEGKAVEPATDWYSLGAVLCFLLTGKPFQRPEACRSIEQLKQLRPEAPTELLVLCTNLLAENPTDRPNSQTVVNEQLNAAEKGLAARPPQAAAKPSALPRAKAEPGSDVAKSDSSPGKPRKPPVARRLSDTPAASVEDTATSSSDAFAFAINTSSAPATKKPPVKRSTTGATATSTDGGSLVFGGASSAASQPAKKGALSPAKSKLPLIIGGAIGGGVLLVALIVGLAFMLLSGGDEKAVADASAAADVAGADEEAADDTRSATDEANSVEANPIEVSAAEANPVQATVEEANPAPAEPASEETPAANEPPASSEGSGSEPAEMPAEPKAATPADSLTAAIEASANAEPTPTEPAAPAPMPEAPKSPPPPAPPKPAGNPFAGFAKAVSLPQLPSGMSEATPEMLAPVILGPCKVDDNALIIVRLLGGETAFRGGRQKFLLDAAENGTAERDWEIRCGTDNDSEVIALLSAKDQNISFQWTPAGAKNAASPFLTNCLLEFSAGSGNHQCALRETVTAEPLVLELEKPSAGVKWSLDALPDERQLEVEVVSVQSGAPKSRIEANTLSAEKLQTNVLMGVTDDQLPLVIELKLAATARQVEVKAATKVKLDFLPPGKDRFNKKSLQTMVNQSAVAEQGAEQRHMVANQIKDKDQKKKALEQADIFKAEVAKAKEQVLALQSTVQAAPTTTVHFRVWYLADTARVLLLDTGGPPPPGPKK